MRIIVKWSEWRIATKILVIFLSLSVISMGIVAYLALSNMRGLGNYALESSTSVGERAIHDSTSHLVKLGER
jgi:hypothetical protein